MATSTSGSKDAASNSPEDPVRLLIAAGKFKKAVEIAKEQHKRFKTPETEQRLVDAYIGRIDEFRNKRMVEEAQTLLSLVRERFPSYTHRLKSLEIGTAAAQGDIERLVAPLAAGGPVDPAIQAAIEAGIRQQLTDLRPLASCSSLPADHPLRVAAGAIWQAFEAVTRGLVTDEQVALPDVSRRSPLAAWKLLVRAIAAFYRNDDASCRRALEGIPADAAVHRLVPALLGMLPASASESTAVQSHRASGSHGMAGALRAAVMGEGDPLRASLDDIDRTLREAHDLPHLKASLRSALRTCASAHPELLEQLRQHLYIAVIIQRGPITDVLPVLGSVRLDAYFWRLFARCTELLGQALVAAAQWERFLRHATAEGLIAPNSLAEATVWLRAARGLGDYSMPELRESVQLSRSTRVFVDIYADQPPEIAALAPRSDDQITRQVLDPNWLYQRAVNISPDADTFEQWWSWAVHNDEPEHTKELIATTWHAKRPGDARPLLILSALAEQRKALKMALGYLSQAEAIDPLNPAVRQARVRLTLSTTWRHFQNKKPHLVEKDIAELAAMPGMLEGDRGAFMRALRAAWQVLRNDAAAASEEVKALVEQVGAHSADAIWTSVASLARLPIGRVEQIPQAALPDPLEVARAEARTLRLAMDLKFPLQRPHAWDPFLIEVLRRRPCPQSEADIYLIGKSAVADGDANLAYEASAAGLANAAGVAAARFLLIRAQSLANAYYAAARGAQCLRAAMELARQNHDLDLVQAIRTEVSRNRLAREAMEDRPSQMQKLSDELLADVLRAERKALHFPKNAVKADEHLVLYENLADEDPFDVTGGPDDEYDDAEDEAGAPPLPKITLAEMMDRLPPHLAKRLERMLKGGRLPSAIEIARSDPELMLALMLGLGPAAMGGFNVEELRGMIQELGGDMADDGPVDDDVPDAPFNPFSYFSGRRKKNKKDKRKKR